MEMIKRCFLYQHTCCNDGIFFLALPCMYFTPFFACVSFISLNCVLVFSPILPKSLKDANDAWKKLYTNTKYNSGKSIRRTTTWKPRCCLYGTLCRYVHTATGHTYDAVVVRYDEEIMISALRLSHSSFVCSRIAKVPVPLFYYLFL